MEILDQPESVRENFYAQHAGKLELAFFVIYLAGSFMALNHLPGYLPIRLLGLLGLVFVYGGAYVLRVQGAQLTDRAQRIIFTAAFMVLALYVVIMFLSLFTFVHFIGSSVIVTLKEIIDVLNYIVRPGMVVTLLYSLFVWHRVGKRNPRAYQLAQTIWPRQLLLVGFWALYYIVMGGVKL